MHYVELEWNQDFDKIFRSLTTLYISMPSILDKEGTIFPKLPIIFDEVAEGYERPWNTHKQSLHLQRIKNPSPMIEEFMVLLDKYNLHHNIDFFHQSYHSDITAQFLPHKHKPEFAQRSRDSNGNAVHTFNGDAPGETMTEMQDIKLQLTFPFINSGSTETLWSSLYDIPFDERRMFKEEEITGRFRLGSKPALFDVGSWHIGGDTGQKSDRILFGIPSKYDTFEEGVEDIDRIIKG